MADTIPELREGDPYPGADYFNTLRKVIHRALRIGVEDGSGLTVSQGTDGTVIGGGGSGLGGGGIPIRTTSAITARSGATPGTGTGVLVRWNGTALADGAAITLRNITGGSLASGKYGFATLQAGTWFVTSLEC